MTRPTRAIIDTKALRHNFSLAQSLSPNAQMMPMIKANAYGHGALLTAQALADMAPAFGVACIEEALELRDGQIEQPILLLEGNHSEDELQIAEQQNLWLMIENHSQLQVILNAKLSAPLTVWIKFDTGMHRLGFAPEDAKQVFAQLNNSANIAQTPVLATHFACADNLDNPFTNQQHQRFLQIAEAVGEPNIKTSLSNSATILGWPEINDQWQRPGIMLFGASPFDRPQINADQVQSVMDFQSAVISIRTIAPGESVGYTANWTAQRSSRIATIAVGYGDGYPRQAPNGTPVLIRGVKCPLVGCVSMDMISVDITDLDHAIEIGEPVTLWGPELPVNMVAKHCNTIGYELLTRMPSRVPRILKENL